MHMKEYTVPQQNITFYIEFFLISGTNLNGSLRTYHFKSKTWINWLVELLGSRIVIILLETRLYI